MSRATCFVALLAVTACSESLEFANWTTPVPEGTRIIEYAHVPLDARSHDAVRLVEDLVIGNDLSDPDAVLYEPFGVVAASNGNIFVGDRGSMHIKMFSPEGEYLKTLGQEGQGPGEFARLSGITIAGDVLLVSDTRNRRFSIWTLEGEFIADHSPTSRTAALSIEGLADGSFLSVSIDRDADGGSRAIVQHTREGEEISRLLQVALPPATLFDPTDIRVSLQGALDRFDDTQLAMTVASGEVAYVSPVVEYQVMALSAAGESLWALRVAWERAPFPERARQRILSSWVEQFGGSEAFSMGDFNWPPRLWAVQSLATDDAGRLFVFLLTELPGEEPPDEVPVDVFSPDGEFLAAGIVPSAWSYARGDYVYGIRPDEFDEMVVVRYRVEIDGR